MIEPRVSAAGGPAAIRYVFRQARASGHPADLIARLRAHNACKTCAVGMGGDAGGMVNEAGHFPEVCKKSVQAQAADMQPGIPESFFADNDLEALLRLSPREAERLGRLTFPVVLRPGERRFRRIDWPQALRVAGDALAAADPQRTFLYLSGRSSNEAAFLAQLVARAYGTPHIHNCSFYCHNASSVALGQVTGTGTATVTLDDLGRADLAVVVGANPASNHPRLITQLVRLRERGGRVVVVNPMSELGLRRFRLPSDVRSLARASQVSDLYLQPRVGGDVHLLTATLKRLAELGALDDAFIDAHTNGWPAVSQMLEQCHWEELLAGCGLPRAAIDEFAEALAAANAGVLMWAMGLTHHRHGTDNILALANLALARGFLGRPGTGLLPIRGHSNVQGIGSMGVAPELKERFAEQLLARYAVASPPGGQDTYASMVAAHDGRVDAAVLVGGNLWGSNPDSVWAADAMQRIGTTVSLTTKLNPGHFHGRGGTALILPVLARDEERQETTQESMFNYVRFSAGGLPNLTGEMRSEVDIIAALARRILPPGRFGWTALTSHAALRRAIAGTVPGYEALAAPPITGRGNARPTREFTVRGRILHEPTFPTVDGRASFHQVALPDADLAEGQLMMMTLRSEGQFNTVVYEDEDLYRGNRRRDVIMINATEAARRGLADGDRVLVRSAVGSMAANVAVVDISGDSAAMYYPEANVLVPRELDPVSRTPAFKSVPVTLDRLPTSPV